MLVNKYPLDLTGVSPDNFIPGEVHDLVDNGRDGMRVFVPNYGAFFTQGMILRDALGAELRPNDDYIATYLYEDPTHRSGLEVCGAVIVLNPNVASPVYLDYQVVGGDFAVSSNALEQVLQTLQDDDRPVVWANIIGKPSTYPAGGHLHALWELYGFEYMVAQLERITQAIVAGDQAMFDETRAYAFSLFEDSKGYTDELDQRFQDHANNTSNPHAVTKSQVGLGSVDNFATATLLEIETGTATDRFVTVHGLVHGIDFHIGSAFGDHLADISNPHQVTKTQVGLSNVDNFSTASQAEAEAGTRADRFMTAERTGQAIAFQAGIPLTAHINDQTNPHAVTKAQVGLGDVENFPVATSEEALLQRQDRYMTPFLTDELVADRLQNLNASYLTSGTVPDARLSGSYSGLTSVTSDRFLGAAADGATTPSFAWSGDSNTGMYRVSSTEIGFTINGTKTASISPTQIWSKGDVRGFSDRRLKRNFEDFCDPLGIVKQLWGGLFERIDMDGRRQVGMIAQEVMALVPELVAQSEDGFYGISYGNAVALLVEAIKQHDRETSDRFQALEQRIVELEGS